MTRPHTAGYTLILTLLVLALVAGGMAVLAAAVNAMNDQTQRMTWHARQRDLQASARAWAARHPAGGGPKKLNVDALKIPSAQLEVTAAAGGEVRAVAACALGPRTVRRSVRLPAPGPK